MTKYYKFSGNQDSKYIEVTEKEFICEVIRKTGHFYISFGNAVLECSKEEYRRFRTERNRHRHLKQIENQEHIVILQLDEEICSVPENESAEEEIMNNALYSFYKSRLMKAMEMLDKDEQYLIDAYYFQRKSQKEIGNEIGENQQNISRKLTKILYKLNELLKN